MSRHLPLLLTTVVCLLFVVVHMTISPRLSGSSGAPALAVKPSDKPDFSSIQSVRKRKQAFFTFMDAYITKRNQEILALRERIAARQVDAGELQELATRYRIKSEDPAEIHRQLMLKVDKVPPSLVKAQAAIESAWGTSRFAVEGNNYFGQWCFKEGCGLVPEARPEGKYHEVRLFSSPQASVNSYMRNLNSHPAYRELRQARANLRAQNQALNGCVLAQGLERYSEKGLEYVEVLKQLIRVNKLERDAAGHCAAVMVAEDEPRQPTAEQQAKPEPRPQDIAEDDSQSQLSPMPDANRPPSS
ncbi:MAG TPA: glycoside hydrolase family 73 [Gammaproteobacteria bacterium]|jgi:Bax protein|nr:glycoside hydrolase family 73 [Gammaproteobacteria bacterium]